MNVTRATTIFAGAGHYSAGNGERYTGGLFRATENDCTWRAMSAGLYCASRCGQVFGIEDDASWREYPLPRGVQDVDTVACG